MGWTTLSMTSWRASCNRRGVLAGGALQGRPDVDRVFRAGRNRCSAYAATVAVHIVERFAVSRPRALLGHENFNRLLGSIRDVVGMHPRGTFKTFRVSAAGSDSGIFRRLRIDLGAALGLEDRSDERPPSSVDPTSVNRALVGRY